MALVVRPRLFLVIGALALLISQQHSSAIAARRSFDVVHANVSLTLAIQPTFGPDGQLIAYTGSGYTQGGMVAVLMTGDGLIVDETTADNNGLISGSFEAPVRIRLTGESTNTVPVFAIDQSTGHESPRVTFRYVNADSAVPTPAPRTGHPHHPMRCGSLRHHRG